MPQFHVTAPDGRQFQLDGEAAPSEAELDDIFKAVPVKRNPLGESRQDLESKMIDARAESAGGKLLDRAINTGMAAAKYTPLRGTAARLFNLPGNEQWELPPLVSPEQALHAIKTLPNLGGAEVEQSDPVKKGLQEFGAETASGLTSPDAIETMALPGSAGARLFQAQMIKSVPESIQRTIDAYKSGDKKETTKAVANLALAVGGPAMIEKALAPKPGPEIPPLTGKALDMPKGAEPPPEQIVGGSTVEPAQPEPVKPTVTPPEAIAESEKKLANETQPKEALPPPPDQTPSQESSQGQGLQSDRGKEGGGQGDAVAALEKLKSRKADLLQEIDELQPPTTAEEAQREGHPEMEGQIPWSKEPRAEAARNELYEINARISDIERAAKGSEGKASEPISVGPGGKTVGEPPYRAIQQLQDQLKSMPSTPAKQGIPLAERVAEKWAQGKDAMTGALGKLRAISEVIKSTARGVRKPTSLDARVGELDFALQRSSAESVSAGKVIEKQIPDKALADALALHIDAGGDTAAIRDTLANLPKNTPARIRRALERAANLKPEELQMAQTLKQYFGIRENDAVEHDIFEQGLGDYFTHIWKKESNMPDDLRAAISNGRVSEYFQFSRQRKIPTFLQGILSGKVPELDPSKVIPFYNYALDRAIASREFIRDATKMKEADGRPTTAPTGVGQQVPKGSAPEATLIEPLAKPEAIADYRSMDHPALRKWKWAGEDANGNPILYRGDLVVHPDAYERIARMMDRGRLTPTATGRALLRAGTEVKGFKLGLLSAFHQIHVGSHALWHWTLPFHFSESDGLFTKDGAIDWESPKVKYAVEKGHLQLAPNPTQLAHFSEGLISPGLVQKLPIVGPWSRAYSEWLFGQYIPKLKVKTFENAMARNRSVYAKDLASGKLTEGELASRVGDAVNNAYGELNQLFIGKAGRDPRFQRILRGAFLAPDFGEARLRFVVKSGTKYGHEERIALATMFLTMYTTARVANYLSHGDPEMDWKRAFQVKAGDHWWTMRSVIGDVFHAVSDFGGFAYNRLSPLYSRTIIEGLTHRNARGERVNAKEQLQDFGRQFVPIQLGGLTDPDKKLWETFVTAMGVTAIQDRPEQDVNKMVGEYLKKADDPKLKEIYERRQKETFGESAYKPLREALRDENPKKAADAYQKLLTTHKASDVTKAIRPFSIVELPAGLGWDRHDKPFGGLSRKQEQEFIKTLSPSDRKIYERAKAERQQVWERYQAMLKGQESATPPQSFSP